MKVLGNVSLAFQHLRYVNTWKRKGSKRRLHALSHFNKQDIRIHRQMFPQYASLTQSITGLRVDVRRGKQEWEELNHSLGCVEGQLTALKQQKENLQNQIESLQAEIQAEYMELGIQMELSDDGFSSVINNLVYHKDSTTLQITLSTSVLTTLSKHYLFLQLQEQDSMLIPQVDSFTKQMTVRLQ